MYDMTPQPQQTELLQRNKHLHQEWRQSERSLRRANKRIANILDSITDMYLCLNRDWEVTHINARAESLLGMSRAELVGKNLWDKYPPARHRQLYENFNDALAHQTEAHFEDFCELCGAWFEWNAYPSQDGISLYARDITAYKQAEERVQQSMDRMRHSMNGVVQAMSFAVETRDPYTAGHQRRVSRLAVRIGAAMRLPADQIEGLRIGGLLHDVGKIAVPAEILSRPGKLSTAETSIVRMHVDVGYNILKEIEFAAPVALMALQHHERMDGSGYPHGLRGHEIIQEARILAVADVVEAMASHRPYRSALGLPAAMQEIMNGRSIRYDAEAADACLALFHASGFDIEEALLDD